MKVVRGNNYNLRYCTKQRAKKLLIRKFVNYFVFF